MSPTRPKRGRVLLLGALLIVCLVAAGIPVSRAWRSRQSERCFERARAALDAGDWDTLAWELKTLNRFDDYAQHRRFLHGSFLLRQGRPAEAIDQFEGSVEHPLLRVDTLILAGRASYQIGRGGGAQKMWEEALQLDRNAVDAHRWLGVLYYDLGAMQEAIVHLKRVAELAPDDPRPSRLMGLINKDYERFKNAVGHYRESLRRDPEQESREAVLLEMAECHLKLRDFASALESLQGLPETAEMLTFEAECHHNLGDDDKAQALLDQALTLAPTHLPGLVLQGSVSTARGDRAGAAVAFETAVRHHPKDYHLRYKLAQSLRQLGKNDEADRQTQAAEELRKMWREFSRMHLEATDQPIDAELRYRLGRLALELDRPGLARNWFKAALLLDPTMVKAAESMRSLDVEDETKERTSR